MQSANEVKKVDRPLDRVRLVGGLACLDFVNTIHDRQTSGCGEDYIATPESYLEWSYRAGLIALHEHVAAPTEQAARHRLMQRVHAFREHLHALFSAVIDCASLPDKGLSNLETWLRDASSNSTLLVQADGRVDWGPRQIDPELPLRRIALSALDQLRDEEPRRLKRCLAEQGCGWIFLDVSKNNRRRWCAMETCGTASKMANYRVKSEKKLQQIRESKVVLARAALA